MNILLLLLATSLVFGASQGAPKLKSPEELREACDKLGQEANRVIGPAAPKSCGSFLSGSLEGSRMELKKEFEGNNGVIHYCHDVAQKLKKLREYREGVNSGCEAAGMSSAMASTQTKSKNQDALMAAVAASREKIGSQQAGCAGAIAPVVRNSSPDHMIREASVPEPKPANAPKDTYPEISKDIVNRQTKFINDTADNGGAANHEDEKDQCGKLARGYLALAKRTRTSFDQMSDLTALDGNRAVSELEKYREKASTAMNNGVRVKNTVDKFGAEIKPRALYNDSQDEPGGAVPEYKVPVKYNNVDD